MANREKWDRYFRLVYERVTTPEDNIFLFRICIRLLADLLKISYVKNTFLKHGLPEASYKLLESGVEAFLRTVKRSKGMTKIQERTEEEGVYYASLMFDIFVEMGHQFGDDADKLMKFEVEFMELCEKYQVSKSYYLEKKKIYDDIRNSQEA